MFNKKTTISTQVTVLKRSIREFSFVLLLISLLLPFSVNSFASSKPTAGYGLDTPEEKKAEQPLQESFVKEYYPDYPPIQAESGKEELAKRGEYLAKMGDCIACHSDTKEGKPAYAGGLPIKTPFGTFYSPNITPDKKTGIGNWTEEDFIRAMKEGRDPKGRNYFPVFPYIYFAKMSREDASALYTYFMSIPPVEQENKSMPFPFNIPGARLGLWGWNLLFFFPEGNEFIYDTTQSPAWNRGRYIVDGLGHCSMCHTPLNPLGAPKNRYYLTGAFVDGYWSPNITKHGLSMVGPQEIANVFKDNQLINNAGPVAGPMAEVNHNSLGYLNEEDRLAIGTYLKTVESEETLKVPPSDGQPTLKRGRQVYVNSCIICHQNGEMGAPVLGNGPSWHQRLKTTGLTGLYRHAIYGYNSMPVKGACATCSENDVAAAVDYILKRSLSRSQWHDVVYSGEKHFPSNGKVTYETYCVQCHQDGKNGAPRTGEPEVWKTLASKNIDVLVLNVLDGKNHPKKGGCESCSTGEVTEAIKYMLSQSGEKKNYSLW